MTEILRKFGRALRERREEKGFSQESFADLCGLHRTYIGAVERGERNVSLKNIQKICQALGMTMSAFFSEMDS